MKITILGKTYGFEYVRDQVSVDQDMMGRSSLKGLEISISSHMPLDNMEETLLHEIIHQVVDMCHLEISEQDISTISAALYTCSAITVALPERDPISYESEEKALKPQGG